tara:strand:- start:213 stop:512 length:300 start_codon:yes stop_codon:yes gene_type:complete
MKKTISEYEFNIWFKVNRPNNFSYAGRQALFEYLEEYEDSTGEQIEFDPIALCCEYTEYDNIAEFHLDYDAEDYPDKDAIMDYTQVIEFGVESFIIQQF